ncbi:MAG: iron-sulfur cluster assembly scaffold protein [Promethearchaeota archaeon]
MKIYTDKVLNHFRNPWNQREMKDCDAVGRAGSAECGDYMFVYIRLRRQVI